MIFNTFEFAVFFVVVYVLYLSLSHRLQNRMLLAASYFFYGYWNWKFLSLILLSTVIDYFCGLGIGRHRSRSSSRISRLLLAVSVAGNIGILAIFKYYNFFAENLYELLQLTGLGVTPWVLEVVLPVGISFYTFQTLSYTIDVYRGDVKPTRKFLDFALYVAFFPQLVAGPIERATNLLPQVLKPRRITREKLHDGAWLTYWGLFKKIFIADNLARIVDRVYDAPGDFSGPAVILATYAFAGQIYCDFSGYTDIARGIGKMMGFEIRLNFNLPYFAKNPSDFWRRWHISLSKWIRDYLYIPLGGSRGTRGRVVANLFVTMALAGLWHGAKWNFVLWGLYHAALLAAYYIVNSLLEARRRLRGAEPVSPSPSKWRNALSIFTMFHLTCLGWMLFRAQDARDIGLFLSRILTDWTIDRAVLADLGSVLIFSSILIAMQIAQYRKNDLMAVWRLPAAARAALYVLLYLCISLGGAYDDRQFIYFQF